MEKYFLALYSKEILKMAKVATLGLQVLQGQ